jgi:hypothetical protein
MNESQYIYFNSNPILDPLTQNWEKIRDEFNLWLPTHIGENNIYKDDTVGRKPNHLTENQPVEGLVYSGIFKSMTMFIRDTLLDEREAVPLGWPNFRNGGAKYILRTDRVQKMPTIGNWLHENFNILGSVQFNICTPGSKLNHHWGLDYNYLRLHLVLKSAKGAFFDIENERHEWVDGELFGFDDSMVMHGTKHTGDDWRAIVLIDILKDAVRPYAKTWPIKPWQERNDRPKIVITDW